jgi:phage replication initiation protein
VRPDWVRITFADADDEEVEAVLCQVFGVGGELRATGRGLLGFAESWQFVSEGVPLARYARGGDAMRGRAMIEISGGGCEAVRAWSELIAFAEAWDGRLTRLDLALDTEAVTVDQARAAWEAGQFNARGRPPTARLVDDLGCNSGRTLYVGRRGNDRFLRCYEKGKQLGDRASRWVRVEVELLAAKCVLPLGAIVDGAAYFAGAYKWLAALVDAGAQRPERVRRAAHVVLGRALEIARQQVGGLVGYITGQAGWSAAEVVRFLWRPASGRVVGALPPDGWQELCRFASVSLEGA